MSMVDQASQLWAPVSALSTSAEVRPPPAKRALDAVGAAVLLVVLGPLLGVLALAVGLTSPGPVLFRQRRVGRGGVEFDVVKFRTMHRHAERQLRAVPDLHASYVAYGYKLPLGADPRVTRVGAVLRRLDLDELPQLWNVLRGQMSLVGPRPVPHTELARYGGHRCHYEAVRPGMTGLWQVSGRNRLAYDQRVALDVDYAQHLSFGRDLAILARTLPAMVRGGGSASSSLEPATELLVPTGTTGG
ncbi:MAG TPA: sugar transferase [Acidimicrobiales bacterium]|nr:sugar transferase [Acidimicrobiales bacterium]